MSPIRWSCFHFLLPVFAQAHLAARALLRPLGPGLPFMLTFGAPQNLGRCDLRNVFYRFCHSCPPTEGIKSSHYYIVVSVSVQGIRGSSNGSKGGSAPVPSQRGQSTSMLVALGRDHTDCTCPATSRTAWTVTRHWPSHHRHSRGGSGGSVGGWGKGMVMVMPPLFLR